MNFEQAELMKYFNYKMNEVEQKNVDELKCENEIKILKEEVFHGNLVIKYITNIGYLFISEGYLIMDDGYEQQNYFLKGKAVTKFGARKVIKELIGDERESIKKDVQSVSDVARIMNYRLHAEQLSIPVLNGFELQNDNNPQTILLAAGNGFIEQLTSDGYIEEGNFEKRIDLVINNTKEFMRNNNLENVDDSFIYYKDYNNGIFNFKLYVQDMIIPSQNEKKVIRSFIAYFVEPKMHDFYQLSLGAGPFTLPTQHLKTGIIDLQNDEVTILLDKLMNSLLDNLKYKN